MKFYHLSLRGGFIFSSVVFASCIVSLHLPIYCCTIISNESHLLSTVYAYVKYKAFIVIVIVIILQAYNFKRNFGGACPHTSN